MKLNFKRSLRGFSILSMFLIGILVFSGCTGQVELPETETETEKTTPEKTTKSETATTTPIVREKAAELVSDTAKQVWKRTDQTQGLRVNQYEKLLPKGTVVKPAEFIEGEIRPEIICKNQCYLYLIDQAPGAHFAHPVQIVVLDAVTGEQQVIQTEWWPEVNDEPVFSKVSERTDPKSIIFRETPQLTLATVKPMEIMTYLTFVPFLGTCEAWAVIVCGYNDLPDTFDEDTNGMYNVLRNLDVPDDHIFYVSPHTTHAGVDRATSKANVEWAINQVADRADANDRVLFFYSSHGGTDSLTCTGGGGSISASTLDNWLDTITCEELVVVIEACHSGSVIGKYADGTYVAAEDDLTGEGETNRAIFTSASTDTSSWPDKDGADDPNPSDIGSETIWGYVEAFSVPSADTNGNGEVSFGEAWRYAWNNDVTRIRGWNTPQVSYPGLNPDRVYNYCPCSDLTVLVLSHYPVSPTTKDNITFTAIVQNRGAGLAGSSTLSFRVGGETFPETFLIPALVPGELYIVQRQEVLGVAQNYLVTVIVDVDDAVAECNEANNEKKDAFAVKAAPLTIVTMVTIKPISPVITRIIPGITITAITLSPDLVVETLTHKPATPTTVNEITFTAIVKNIGNGLAGPSMLSFKVGGETFPPTYQIPTLAPGETYTVQRQEILDVAQNYLVTVIVDVNNDVSESNEENNQATDRFTVVLP